MGIHDDIEFPKKFFFFLSLINSKQENSNILYGPLKRGTPDELIKSALVPVQICRVSTFKHVDNIVKDIIKGGYIRKVKQFENERTKMPILVYEIRDGEKVSQVEFCY